MKKITLSLATLMLVSQFSLAIAAEPITKQPRRPPMQQQRGNVQQFKITPEYLNQQILTLTQQVKALQTQVNALRSVVQITQNGTTIQAEYLTITGKKNLVLTSSKKINLTGGDDLNLTSGKSMVLKGGKDVTVEGAGKIKLKAPQIKLNDGTKSVARVTSSVTGGKVVSGSNSVFVP